MVYGIGTGRRPTPFVGTSDPGRMHRSYGSGGATDAGDGYEWINRGGHLYKRKKKTSLVDEFQKAADEATAENERRYEDILGGYERRYSDAMSALEGLGEQQREDVTQQFTELGARQRANLRARGLAGTTIMPAMEQGLASQEAAAQRRLEEALTRERMGYQVGLSEDTLRFKERREDEYPDFGQLERLAYMKGQSGRRSRGYGAGAAGIGGWMGIRPPKSSGRGVYFPGVGSPQPGSPFNRPTTGAGNF